METLLLFSIYFLYCEGAAVSVNERPIIGILSQEQSYHLKDHYAEENFTSYIAASYVKGVESSGARVVPILIGKNRSYYKDLMSKINGVLFPGGATYFNQSDGYADAGQHIYELAMELNDAGDYFPIFGTCLGFELLVILASGRGEVENRNTCSSHSNRRLDLTDDIEQSKMFSRSNAPAEVIDILKNKDVTANSHQFCILDENILSHDLQKSWRVTSHSYDDNHVRFVSSIENKRYPFYGVQFHPEKIPFEWKSSKPWPHSADAIKANRYFMDFFVNECRKNFHSFSDINEENEKLIYNYTPYYTGVHGSSDQIKTKDGVDMNNAMKQGKTTPNCVRTRCHAQRYNETTPCFASDFGVEMSKTMKSNKYVVLMLLPSNIINCYIRTFF